MAMPKKVPARCAGRAAAAGLSVLLAMLAWPASPTWAAPDPEPSLADEALESKVERRLRMEGRIRWDELRVEAKDGEVTLYGIVKSNEERGFAEKAASTVPDVTAVYNKILVQPNMPHPPVEPEARVNEETRDRVIEGPPGLKDRQVLP
jgi:hypothetical protein